MTWTQFDGVGTRQVGLTQADVDVSVVFFGWGDVAFCLLCDDRASLLLCLAEAVATSISQDKFYK